MLVYVVTILSQSHLSLGAGRNLDNEEMREGQTEDRTNDRMNGSKKRNRYIDS